MKAAESLPKATHEPLSKATPLDYIGVIEVWKCYFHARHYYKDKWFISIFLVVYHLRNKVFVFLRHRRAGTCKNYPTFN